MDIFEFIKKLENEFDEIKVGSVKPDTKFIDLEDWNSMHALIIIALIETDYGVTITGEDLQSVETISGIFKIIESRIEK